MRKKARCVKKWIPVIIWVVFLGVQIAMKMPRNQILYVQSVLTLVILFIMGYRRGVKRYRSIPEKPLEARLLKERFGHDKSYPDRPVAVGVYEYTLEGKTHRIKLQKMNPGFPDTATLFYLFNCSGEGIANVGVAAAFKRSLHHSGAVVCAQSADDSRQCGDYEEDAFHLSLSISFRSSDSEPGV